MTLNHDFDYSFPLFSSLFKKRWKRKRRMNSKNRDFSHAFLFVLNVIGSPEIQSSSDQVRKYRKINSLITTKSFCILIVLNMLIFSIS